MNTVVPPDWSPSKTSWKRSWVRFKTNTTRRLTLLEPVSESEIIVDGRLPIEEIEEALGVALTGEDDAYGTAAGFVHWHLDRLPQQGDHFDSHGVRAEVLDVEGHRLRRLRLTRIAGDELPQESENQESRGDATPLLPERVTDDPGWLIHRYDSVASTMKVASQFALFGARERTVVVSTEQTDGRGRGGRSWRAEAGSAVFATLILRPPVAAPRLSTLPLIAGVAVAEAIERIAGCTVWLKWPNDVWLGVDAHFAKVAGVLVTTSLRGDTVDHALVGIGINVLDGAQDLPRRSDNDPGGHKSHSDPGRSPSRRARAVR